MNWNPKLRRQRTVAGDGGFLSFSRHGNRGNRRASDRFDGKFSRLGSTRAGTYSFASIGSKWRVFWGRVVGNKRKIVSYQYDPSAYAHNFDEGLTWSPEDNRQLPKSFSARFADPASFVKGQKEKH
ncbi:hypothetical protein ZOSMA_57G00310 [Zostera marina]|uniref:Uncharacterized protein n=1 Tax=Zostera marina TaxID=29655 RepID=A0A0K9NVC4_ZOSMR|nr:hypothetical protein ZOSMA_57G00310 [Zostera marina]